MALASPTFLRPHPGLDAVVWDFDGTLVASRAADEHAVDQLLIQDPSAAAGVERFWASEGRPIEERVERAWPGRSAEILPLFEARILPHVFRGVRSTLKELERQGYRMAVVSSRRREALLWGLEATGMLHYFTIVLGLDDVDEPKPSPEGLLRALRGIGVPPSRAVYIGDSAVDVLAGRAAGVTVWRAGWCGAPDPTDAPARLLTSPLQVTHLLDAAPH